MAGVNWPALVDGDIGFSANVEAKFAWLQGHIVPMVGGSTTMDALDLGTSTARWNNLHANWVKAERALAAAGATTIFDMTTTGILSYPNQSLVRVWGNGGPGPGLSTGILGDFFDMNQVSVDLQGEWTTGATAPSFVAKAAGKYLCSGHGVFLSSTVQCIVQLIKNSTTVSVMQCRSDNAITITVAFEDIVTLAAGDRVYFSGRANDGRLQYGVGGCHVQIQKIA